MRAKNKTIQETPVFLTSIQQLKATIPKFLLTQKFVFYCEDCKKEVVLIGDVVRYKKHLTCISCARKRTWLEKYGVTNPTYLPDHKEKTKQTCLKRYGVKNPAQAQIVKEKVKQHNLQKYGVTSPSKLQEVKEKAKQTNLKKYGVEWGLQNQKIKEKSKQTLMEKYGVENIFQVPEKQEKAKQTWIKKYGVENPFQSETIKEKSIQTCLEKYGTVYPNQSPTIQEKSIQTCLKKYGVAHPWKNKDVLEKRKQTNLAKYGVTTPSQLPCVKEKTKQTMLQKYGAQHVGYKYIYKDQTFDSSWELAVYVWAIYAKKNIKREPIRITYNFECKVHTYYPDFEIDGQLVEVKGPQFFNKKGEMQNPYNHSLDGLFEAKRQCALKHNVQFWGKKDLDPILCWMKGVYGKNWPEQFKKRYL